MTDGKEYNNILLGGRGGTKSGQLRVNPGGIAWKKQGGGKLIEFHKSDIVGLTWMKIPRTYQLGIRSKDGAFYKFTGFRDQDVSNLTTYIQTSIGLTPVEKQLSVSGKNWGDIELDGSMLTFKVGSKQGFEVSLADVSLIQMQGKNDVMLQFHEDDNVVANEKDSLVDMSFHIPDSNVQYVGDENRPPAQVFRDRIMSMGDLGPGEEPVVTFEGISILTPRGRYNVELHASFLRLQAQANDFKIQYSSIWRLFLLPKSNQPHTFVVVTLDTPIRKGQTLYPHVVLQLETESVVESTLSLGEDALKTKYQGKLEPSYKGLIHEVFTKILRGLSGGSIKITRPGSFRSCQDGYAVKSSLKAEDGVLYPLEKGFFFLPKPPTLILHDEIEFVEFEMHAAAGTSMQYFDLLVKLKNEQEHLFCNIQRNEYHNLSEYITSKGLKIMKQGNSRAMKDAERFKNEIDESDDETDDDFKIDRESDGGSPTDDSGGEESDASLSGDVKQKPAKKESRKEASTSKPASSKRKSTKDGVEDGGRKKKAKKKRDPNAPKKATSSFMFFSNAERENIKKSNPGISFTDIARTLGEHWKKMTAEEKEPYEAMAAADRERYQKAMAAYKGDVPASIVGSDSE
ncbi:FACT complex subunit SSRP1-like [Papaver somniferum]|uniref:FACT complex subunit SSRP1-like n=1 Tax=Papaver somniferum TaxID=3469 RepID=UPI000E6F4A6C|nr:FACT complex subunit SSRP1-like [Papaver somniferum]